jgi:hypothetical protein
MTTTIAEVMAGIETRLQTVNGLRTRDVSPDQIVPPCAIVGVPPIDYLETFKQSTYTIRPTVTVFTSAALTRAGQIALAKYAEFDGSNSIFQAIRADQTLGGKVDYCVVLSFRPLGLEEVGIVGYYGGIFELEVSVS